MDKRRIRKKLFWDRHIDEDYMLELMERQPERFHEDIVNRLYPKDLKEKYRYARKILLQ